MDGRFQTYVESLHPQFVRLMEMEPTSVASLPRVLPLEAIYLFSEKDRHLYVGRTRELRRRMRNHCGPSSQHNQAVFAFRLAREVTGNLKADYAGEGKRSLLIQDPEFLKAFVESKRRIRSMELRFVQESDPLRQALLEIYVSIALQTPYNDFNTH